MLELQQSIIKKALSPNRKIICSYKGVRIALTGKQIEVLKLVAKGFSNSRISQQLKTKEPTLKLQIYRLMKYLESNILENIDRFYLVVIAQQIEL